ncbi:pyrimidine 5'-nucleotidase [Sulfitobacter sp. SK012]|uniref:pyrimidine 5'-nucleotidase n=1 Tax=Sulfitobacter sp. SK012 TaxID=1389005 RepID=UPI000E0B3D90|nr:pyrimidine 5'-nucleotidase [Sulfitobacter sp. SK012]AXI47359.1 pyrimidine 5'-nucleotidase [Sulfitobacter sp. SK012]
MSRAAFSHVTTWVFDLDHTLYPPSARLFDLIEVRMTAWVMDALGVDAVEADRLRLHYWQTYGTTLAGLMREHNVDPAPYLEDVHDISMASLIPNPQLAARLTALPGRRIVYTNGCVPYANRVLAALGIGDAFEAVYGVETAGFFPKPERAAFERIFALDGLDPTRAAMFEDDARNLAAPHDMGLSCVHVGPTRAEVPHVHFHTNDLTHFLSGLVSAEA